jgi:general secretion pathway protein I
MVLTLKIISWLTFRRNPIADAGISEIKNQDPESKIRNPASSIQHPAAPGFTLLEVMVSVAIMSIVLVSVYRLHSQSLTMDTESRFYTQAPMLAQGKLAEMGAGEDAEFTDGSGEFGENFNGYSWNVSVDDVDIEALGEISQDLKKIEVTVSYNENEFVYHLRTYRIIRGE